MDGEWGRGAKSFASAEERRASLVSYGCSVKLKDKGSDGSRSGVKLKEQQGDEKVVFVDTRPILAPLITNDSVRVIRRSIDARRKKKTNNRRGGDAAGK